MFTPMARNRTNNVIFGFRRTFVPMQTHERWRKQAVAIGLSKEGKHRLEWIIHYETKKNASFTCRHFGIVPKTLYKWKRVFDEKNLRSLETRSRAPIHVRQKTITPLEEERVVTLRKAHLRWGKVKLSVHYKNTYGASISSWKIQYTITKYRLYVHPKQNARTQAKRKRSKEKKRITELKKQDFPGFLLALDTIVIWWNGVKRYIVTGIDTTSKIAFARMYTTKSSKNAADFLRRMMYLLDNEVWNTLHDNGSEFHRHFAVAVGELKLDEYWSRVHTPKDNPVCERFNRTLKDEFIALGNIHTDPEVFNRALTEWLIEYTFVRPHQSLGYQTPWQYYEKSNKLLPMYSSRTPACIFSPNYVVSFHLRLP
jgi:transposase InsO family protein